MTARYVEIGQHPDIRRELRGTLAEVLTAPSPNPGTFAMPEDVPGCFLEMGLDGLWTGASVGSFGSIEELDALPTTYLALGARASVLGVQYTYEAGEWVGAGVLTTYATYAELPASGATEAYLTNAWSPLGKTRMVKVAAGWIPAFGEVLAYERATGNGTLVDVTATALTVGAANEVYQSAVLPDWIFNDRHTLRFSCEAALYGGGSSANFSLLAGPSDGALTGSAAAMGTGIVGGGAASDRGFLQPFIRMRPMSNGTIMGAMATFPVTSTLINMLQGTYSAGATKFRFSANPGATTNRIRLWAWSITMGDC